MKLLLALGLLTLTTVAHADLGLVFEPLGSYALGSFSQGSTSGSYNGPVFGGRGGIALGDFTASVEILGAVSTITPSGTTNSDITPGTIVAGVTGSWRPPLLSKLSVLAGVDLMNYLWWYSLDSNIKTVQFTTSGFGFRVGAGYEVVNHVRVSLEAVLASLSVSTETGVSSANKLTTTQVQLGVGFPFSLTL